MNPWNYIIKIKPIWSDTPYIKYAYNYILTDDYILIKYSDGRRERYSYKFYCLFDVKTYREYTDNTKYYVKTPMGWKEAKIDHHIFHTYTRIKDKS